MSLQTSNGKILIIFKSNKMQKKHFMNKLRYLKVSPLSPFSFSFEKDSRGDLCLEAGLLEGTVRRLIRTHHIWANCAVSKEKKTLK